MFKICISDRTQGLGKLGRLSERMSYFFSITPLPPHFCQNIRLFVKKRWDISLSSNLKIELSINQRIIGNIVEIRNSVNIFQFWIVDKKNVQKMI